MKSVVAPIPAVKSKAPDLSCGGKLVRLLAMVILVALSASSLAIGDMREERPVWTLGFEGFFSSIEGRMGFDQQNAGYGTLNDLREDLGLPWDNISYRIVGSIRPLQHHMLRMYGSVPESYLGQTLLKRELRTTRYPGTTTINNDQTIVYAPGTLIKSQMRTGMFGFGYDLDFLLWPNWVGGFNGDIRYLDLKLKMTGTGVVQPTGTPILDNTVDTINVDEIVPCLGAHSEVVFPLNMGCGSNSTAGAFSRLTYGITPNYLNYVDLAMGLTLNMSPSCRFVLNTKVGYEHESIFHDTQNRNGRVLELKRDGIMFRVEGLF